MHNMEELPKVLRVYRKKAKVTKEELDEIIRLFAEGYNQSAIARRMNLAQATISRLNKSKWFKIRTLEAIQSTNGNITNSLYKKATGQAVSKKVKEVIDRDGNIVELTEVTQHEPDTNAIKLWLTNRDPENWKDNNQVSVQVNQALQGVNTQDLLLTLRSSQSIGGEGGVLSAGVCETNNLPTNPTSNLSTNSLLNLPNSPNTSLNAPLDPVDTAPLSRGYNAEYDSYHERHGKKLETNNNFYDHNQGKLDEPTEGEFDNLGEDVEEEK